MALASRRDILDEMAATLRAAFTDELGTDDEAIQVEGRMVVLPTPNLACVDMFPAPAAEGIETLAFGDLSGEPQFTIRVRTSTVDDVASQDILLQLMDEADPLFVPAILDEDPTLNGLVNSIYFHDPTGFQLFPPGDLVGFTWTVTVIPAES